MTNQHMATVIMSQSLSHFSLHQPWLKNPAIKQGFSVTSSWSEASSKAWLKARGNHQRIGQHVMKEWGM